MDKKRTKIKIDIQKKYHDHIEFIKDVSNILVSKGYYLYFLIKEDFFTRQAFWLGNERVFLKTT